MRTIEQEIDLAVHTLSLYSFCLDRSPFNTLSPKLRTVAIVTLANPGDKPAVEEVFCWRRMSV